MVLHDEKMAEYEKRLKERESDDKWYLAFLYSLAGLVVLATVAALFTGSFIAFGLRGPILILAGALGFVWLVCEVKRRLEE